MFPLFAASPSSDDPLPCSLGEVDAFCDGRSGGGRGRGGAAAAAPAAPPSPPSPPAGGGSSRRAHSARGNSPSAARGPPSETAPALRESSEWSEARERFRRASAERARREGAESAAGFPSPSAAAAAAVAVADVAAACTASSSSSAVERCAAAKAEAAAAASRSSARSRARRPESSEASPSASDAVCWTAARAGGGSGVDAGREKAPLPSGCVFFSWSGGGDEGRGREGGREKRGKVWRWRDAGQVVRKKETAWAIASPPPSFAILSRSNCAPAPPLFSRRSQERRSTTRASVTAPRRGAWRALRSGRPGPPLNVWGRLCCLCRCCRWCSCRFPRRRGEKGDRGPRWAGRGRPGRSGRRRRRWSGRWTTWFFLFACRKGEGKRCDPGFSSKKSSRVARSLPPATFATAEKEEEKKDSGG